MRQYDYSKITDLEELQIYSMLFTTTGYVSTLNLFHYTNASNKKYIFKDDDINLRLTRADKFEDTAEGEHIIEVFRDAVNSCLNNQQIDEQFYNILLSVIHDYKPHCEELKQHYVFCFSKNEKNNYLIKNYACKHNNKGIIIGFHATCIEDLENIEYMNKHSIFLADVLYDKSSLSEYMQHLIIQMYRLKSQDDDNLSQIKKIALNQLIIYALVYKEEKYNEEQETRLIVDLSKVDPCSDIIKIDSDSHYIHIKLNKSCLYNVDEVVYDL